ncbi:MAG TPA: hypothetical protein VHC41_00690, partial [Mycobacteriales bacterium]|nr:hypothetical protein [Mycobacteriales bacterium]
MAATTAANSVPRRISRADVVDCGVAITAASGFESLTLRAVADALQVKSPSLYHHLPGGVRELRSAVVGRITELLEPGGVDTDEQLTASEALERQLLIFGRMAREYPGAAAHILTNGCDELPALAGAERVVRVLQRSGIRDVTPTAYQLIHVYVTGWAFARRQSRAAARGHHLDLLGDALESSASRDD